MTHILLTGAGFSYNWGGPLAADVFNALLSDGGIDDIPATCCFPPIVQVGSSAF
jgi:hypothetical protein